MSDFLKVLSPTCCTFAGGNLSLVRCSNGAWAILDKNGKIVWTEYSEESLDNR